MILFLFGLAGVGKTYVGKLLAEKFGWYFYDGDTDLPDVMRTTIENGESVTQEMRDEFFDRLFASIHVLEKSYPKLVVAQTFLKEKYRVLAKDKFPDAKFLLIQADSAVRNERLRQRREPVLSESYVKKMDDLFDRPVGYVALENTLSGTESLLRQLRLLLG